MSIELEQIVQRPTWKQVLLELIVTEQLDPWNIDLIKISTGFLKKVKEMKKLELFIPANMILASAILLRYKSNMFKFKEENNGSFGEDVFVEEEYEEKPKVNELKLLSRIPPKRPITLNELVDEIDKIIKYEEKRGKIEKKKVEAVLNLKVEELDIEKHMEDVLNMILKQMNGEGYVLFSDLVSEKTERKRVMYTLLSILHLTQENKIDIKQKKLFGDIFISPVTEKN